MGARIVVGSAFVTIVLLLRAPVSGQTVFPPPHDPPSLAATRTQAAIRVDGVLDEAAWADSAVADRFTQTEPVQGAPATEPTEVRALFDDRSVSLFRRTVP